MTPGSWLLRLSVFLEGRIKRAADFDKCGPTLITWYQESQPGCIISGFGLAILCPYSSISTIKHLLIKRKLCGYALCAIGYHRILPYTCYTTV